MIHKIAHVEDVDEVFDHQSDTEVLSPDDFALGNFPQIGLRGLPPTIIFVVGNFGVRMFLYCDLSVEVDCFFEMGVPLNDGPRRKIKLTGKGE